ncbi:hypothetical protein G6L35_08705 [Agrobacterium tumefaciens]|uniref:hypothetical protein n=1 Tax=Agrobacterium tumefaciens TaxID=358 RepID=UPI001572DEF0|nr:hypothetical protein [Agrobacterium tumefaciens]NSZ68710.1 hypothetical protein [Agrobacterium tumefaciens]
MTVIDKQTMNLARKTAGEILYAQSCGEDIANVIARALCAAKADSSQPDFRVDATAAGFTVTHRSGVSTEITARG